MPNRRNPAAARRLLIVIFLLMAGAEPRLLRAQGDVIDSAYSAAETGAWEASARAWRRALDRTSSLAGAAAYTLRAAPADARPGIRRAFFAPPPALGSRRAIAQLETVWGDAQAGWLALQALPPTDSAVGSWVEFADAAAAAGSPLVARDAFVAALTARPNADVAVRAAEAALAAGDPPTALALLDRASAARGSADSASFAVALLPLRVRALARLGRMSDAEDLVSRAQAALSRDSHSALEREVTWGYVRVGDIARARSAATRFGLAADSDVAGWLALYAGDLRHARVALRHPEGLSSDALTALALLARTRVDSAPDVGLAFVLLARGDSASAAQRFVAASSVVRDAAPLLLATAARLHMAQHRDAQAIPLWRVVIEQYAGAPEAPEADLEWGRALKRGADTAGAVARWEHLILTYPESALVPLARRELDAVKATA